LNITILTYGSRGDVQPFLALALGLKKKNHLVKLAAPHRFAEFVTRHDIAFVPLAGDPEVISERFNTAGENPLRTMIAIGGYVSQIAPQVSRAAFTACEDADLIIHSFLFTVGAHSWAYERGVPDISVQTFPVFAPTRDFPNVAAMQIRPGWLSYFSHWLASRLFWYGGYLGYPRARRANPDVFHPSRLYWPFEEKAGRFRTPLLFAFSPLVVPRPSEWGAHVYVPGYFFLDEPDYRPPAILADFLASGIPPVCISFGSMVRRDAERVGMTVLDALAMSGERGVFLTGWNGWKALNSPPNVLFLESVPHDWLLPRCKAVIHHGGAGVTGAGLRAGIPNIVVPHAGDQFFWGRQVKRLGAGPAPIPVRRLTAERLAAALAEAARLPVIAESRRIGEMIRREDGIGNALHLIEALISQP
jgi:sterol 3beta-glucosyltransferase